MESYCVLIETRYKEKKNLSDDERLFAKAIGYSPSKWKKLSHETRLRKLIQGIFDGEDSRIHVLNVMRADEETSLMHKENKAS